MPYPIKPRIYYTCHRDVRRQLEENAEPSNFVSPNVIPIAIQPPTTALEQDLATGASPITAPTPPKATNAKVTAATITLSLTLKFSVNAAASNGTMEPKENARAYAMAACLGVGECWEEITLVSS
ncbi:unnamed protein product [Fraxinus pennsylvanica]|uniref:Uncharacterized protein n=1 Tax=Fraxinus pennsylvanica TaxID=56036 RepID=A0AAD1ZGL5_9LAMI|nr:unnamed protein product [Fraxinus pennsylvanica]